MWLWAAEGRGGIVCNYFLWLWEQSRSIILIHWILYSWDQVSSEPGRINISSLLPSPFSSQLCLSVSSHSTPYPLPSRACLAGKQRGAAKLTVIPRDAWEVPELAAQRINSASPAPQTGRTWSQTNQAPDWVYGVGSGGKATVGSQLNGLKASVCPGNEWWGRMG